jgi:hypothetical protein
MNTFRAHLLSAVLLVLLASACAIQPAFARQTRRPHQKIFIYFLPEAGIHPSHSRFSITSTTICRRTHSCHLIQNQREKPKHQEPHKHGFCSRGT